MPEGLNEEWMPWDGSLLLGIPVVDEQHKHLVYLCNKFYTELMAHRMDAGWRKALAEALRETARYTKTHFATEEKLMQAAGYPEFEFHHRAHVEFVDTVRQFLEAFGTATLETSFEFASYIKEWVLTHIAYEDRQFQGHIMEYCRQNGE